jgi:hypothetical protein
MKRQFELPQVFSERTKKVVVCVIVPVTKVDVVAPAVTPLVIGVPPQSVLYHFRLLPGTPAAAVATRVTLEVPEQTADVGPVRETGVAYISLTVTVVEAQPGDVHAGFSQRA